MNRRANSEVSCPVDGCRTGLQRSMNGTVRDGVLAHLSVVHGVPVAVAQIKYRNELDELEEAATTS